jgi:hypothetical protein
MLILWKVIWGIDPLSVGYTYVLPHYGGGTAKMAEIARGLPKWQRQQISCQNKIFFLLIFFI